MSLDSTIARLDTLSQQYFKSYRKKPFNEIVDIVFSSEAKGQCLDFLVKRRFVESMTSRISWDRKKETVNFYKLLLALVVHEYNGVVHNTKPFEELFGIWYELEEKFKFIDKLTAFAVDETIKDTEFKIYILQIFSIFIVHEDYELLIESYHDFLILNSLFDPRAASDNVHVRELISIPFGRRNEKVYLWMLQLILSFGNSDQTSITEWQVALAKFFQSYVSTEHLSKPIELLLEATKATSYFSVKATSGAIGAVNFLKSAIGKSQDFSVLNEDIESTIAIGTKFWKDLVFFKFSSDPSPESYEKLLFNNLSLVDAKKFIDMYIPPRMQANFETLNYFTDNDDKKRFYISVLTEGISAHLPTKSGVWDKLTEQELEHVPRYIKFATNYDTIQTFLNDSDNEMLDQVKREIIQHLKRVTERIAITGPNSFTGSSKYFWKIKDLLMIKAKQYLMDIEGTKLNDFKYAVAVTLCKPSKESEIRKLGIDKLRIGRIQKLANKYTFICENLDDLDYTHLIVLPSSDALKGSDASKYLRRLRYFWSGELRLKLPFEHKISGNDDVHFIELLSPPKHADISSVLPNLFSSRTIVVIPTDTYLNQYKDISLIRYGDANSVKNVIECANSFFEKLQRCSGMQQIMSLTDIVSQKQIQQVTMKFLGAWKTVTEGKLNNNVDLPIEFQQIVNRRIENKADVEKITKNFSHIIHYLLLCWTICKSELNEDTWKFIGNNFSMMITVDDWIRIIDTIESTASFVLINCHSSVFQLTYLFVAWERKRTGGIKIIGGNLQDFVFNKFSDFIVKSDNHAAITHQQNFIPGFAFGREFISVKDQVEEAEYCVMLYYYMKKLGYSTDSIGIWVSCQRQFDLMKEVVETLLPKSIDCPNVVFNGSGVNNYINYKYSIISLFSDSRYKEVSFTGTFGNFYISANVATDKLYFPNMGFPAENQLHVVSGETYSSTERKSEQPIIIKDLQHLKEFVNKLD